MRPDVAEAFESAAAWASGRHRSPGAGSGRGPTQLNRLPRIASAASKFGALQPFTGFVLVLPEGEHVVREHGVHLDRHEFDDGPCL